MLTDIDELATLDPAAVHDSTTTDAHRAALLHRILMSTPEQKPARQRVSRRGVLLITGTLTAATAAVAVTAGLAVVSAVHQGNPDGGPLRVTPALLRYTLPTDDPSAESVLNQLAARAARTASPARTGDSEHWRTQSWALFTRIANDEPVTSAAVAQETETWLRPDGSTHIVTVNRPPVFRSDADRERWQDDGSPGKDANRRVVELKAADAPRMWQTPPPTDVNELRRYLEIGHPTQSGPPEVLVAVEDLHSDRVLEPAVRSAILRLLAQLRILRYDGTVIDRAGRAGQAFSLDSNYSGLPTRYTVIFSADTGELIADEQVLTTTAGKLNVAIPAVISYTLYLEADWQPVPAE
jgi:hypothetical protein